MTPETLTALLERLERAGAPVKKHNYRYSLRYPDHSLDFLDRPIKTDAGRAALLGWAIGQIEAAGFLRDVSGGTERTFVDVSRQGNSMYAEFRGDAPTELQATLQALAEILESKK